MPLHRILRIIVHSESRQTFIETVVALAIIGVIAVTFLSGLTTTSKAAFIADEQATAGSLAQSQMEWVNNASHNDTGYYLLRPIPADSDYTNYSATITTQPVTSDNRVQKIIINVLHADDVIMKSGATYIMLWKILKN
ncbi:hypothetical protein ACFLT8_04050 [Chloroflexota bacterium]